MVSAFFYGANCLFWMSEKQKDHYEDIFPFLSQKISAVLSSVFSKEFFENVSRLSEKDKNETYLIVGSNSWIKGVDDAISFCKDNSLKYEVVSGITHSQMLEKMSESKGIVFLPKGGDTCPVVWHLRRAYSWFLPRLSPPVF